MPKSPQMSQDTAAKQRRIQQEQDQKDQRQQGGGEKKTAVQAGHHDHPAPPLPKQHLKKPGHEAEMELQPQFMSPDYAAFA